MAEPVAITEAKKPKKIKKHGWGMLGFHLNKYIYIYTYTHIYMIIYVYSPHCFFLNVSLLFVGGVLFGIRKQWETILCNHWGLFHSTNKSWMTPSKKQCRKVGNMMK
jgi:hypothetical protein